MFLYLLKAFVFLILVNQCVLRSINEDAHYFTEYLKTNNLEEAKTKGLVNSEIDANFISYSGYFTVDEKCDSNLFAWFFENKKKSAPVILWLNGGPGVSSLYGLFDELGPYVIQKDMSVTIRKHAWTEEYSVLFVDSPVGVGFSFTKDKFCFARDQDMVSKDLYSLLKQFYTIFSHLKDNDFYIMGESYAGKYIPALAHKIHLNKEEASNYFNFSGIAIGNGLIDPENQMDHDELLFQLNYIDSKQKSLMKQQELQAIKYIKTENWRSAIKVLSYLQDLFYKFTGLKAYYNFLKTKDDENLSYYIDYLRQESSMKTLHVGNNNFSDGQEARLGLLEDIPKSVASLLPEIVKNYKVLLYNGQLDIVVGPILTSNFLTRSKYPELNKIMKEEKKILRLKEDREIAGYIKSLDNFHFVTLRNAGHLVPYDQPENSFILIKKFIENQLN